MRLQSECQPGLDSSEGFTGSGAFRLAPSHSWQVDAGCWQEVSYLCLWRSPKGLLECPCDMAAGFP